MIPGSANPLLLASAAEAAGYNIERSLRFNSADSAYLSRTPSVAGNRKTWTWAGWVKRSALGTRQQFFQGSNSASSSTGTAVRFESDNTLQFFVFNNGAFVSKVYSTQVFRDISAWYHIVCAVDTTQSTASSRVRLYANSLEISVFSVADYPSQNSDLNVNGTQTHYLGTSIYNSALSDYFNGYLADIHFIDGQALDPTSFGEFDDNGVWQPKAYTGTYGTNGFHLPFSDNSTAAALGTDTSGNGNNWTVNNISVTAGSGNDSLVDTPTNYGTDTGAGGEVRGNYCTWNAIVDGVGTTLSDGNLRVQDPNNRYWTYQGTIVPSSGKWYFEILLSSQTSYAQGVGLVDPSGGRSPGILIGSDAKSWNIFVQGDSSNGKAYNNNVLAGDFTNFANGDIIGIAYDLDAGKMWVAQNGSWLNSGNPASGTGAIFTNVFGTVAPACNTSILNGVLIANFGQRPFAYTAPSGFKALCTTNLPEPQTIITSGSYTGNGVADGPFVYLNGVPTAMTVNGTAVTFGTHADKLSNGFKLRTTSTTYNQNAATYNYSVTSTGPTFKTARAQAN